MIKNILMAILCVLVGTIAAYPPNAMFAEIHGSPDKQCVRIYPYAISRNPVHGLLKSRWCRSVNPRVSFYDDQYRLLYAEPLPSTAIDQNNLYDSIQQRLTVLPKAARAVRTAFLLKTPHDLLIELYDARGYLIATAPFTTEAATIHALSTRVSNPDNIAQLIRRSRFLDVSFGRTGIKTRIFNKKVR